ncbi:hypothetical protein FQA47_021875 [Oryzias melastigma]|uniref:Uncharacterized protein n=1 Tax=Oryzias melastigma TaxID=30732 RepID=A0A834F3F9_ORYME|nr:hypothetical protein FQA47_021875 [Oryzias melastigma]
MSRAEIRIRLVDLKKLKDLGSRSRLTDPGLYCFDFKQALAEDLLPEDERLGTSNGLQVVSEGPLTGVM